MTRRERVLAALARDAVDRVPYLFWRRFPAVDRSPASLAQATLRFHERYGSDVLVLAPPAEAPLEAWGCEAANEPGVDGARPCARCAVASPADWSRVQPLDPADAPGFAAILETIVRLGFDRRIGDAPVLLALPSPLSIARRLSADQLAEGLRSAPAHVDDALRAIVDTLGRVVQLVLAEGLAGVLYTIDASGLGPGAPAVYARAGEPHDRQLLATVRRAGGLSLVHAAGPEPILERVVTLPGDAAAWDDEEAGSTRGALPGPTSGAARLGGIDRQTLRYGTPEAARLEVEAALGSTEGRGLIVSPGGPLLQGTPDAQVAAVVTRLGGRLRPLPGVAL
jgi:uroporphyrinogen decarboxylase